MGFEEVLDAFPIQAQLYFQRAEDLSQGERLETLGGGDRSRSAERSGAGEDLHAGRCGFRSPHFVSVEEFLPATLACFDEFLRRGKGKDELPSRLLGPIGECLERGRIVLAQRGPQLIDEAGTLLDQRNLIAAQQAQLHDQWIFRRERFPAMPVYSQGVGKTPGIELIVFDAAGGFALPVLFRTEGVDGIDHASAALQLLNGNAMSGFHGHGDVAAEASEDFPRFGPAIAVVGEAQGGFHLTLPVDDRKIVMIAGPVEAGEVSMFFPAFHFGYGMRLLALS